MKPHSVQRNGTQAWSILELTVCEQTSVKIINDILLLLTCHKQFEDHTGLVSIMNLETTNFKETLTMTVSEEQQ